MNRIKTAKYIIVLIIILFATTSMAADTGFAVRTSKIMDKPFRDAKAIGTLKKGDNVNILKRKGGWLRISKGESKGWVRMMRVRRGKPGGKPAAGTEAKGVLGLASGRAGSGNVVASTGVRGLSEEELKEAAFNGKELKKLESFNISNKDARVFAKEAKLVSRSVDFLPAPERK